MATWAAAYLVGSIPSGVLLTRAARRRDPRHEGSENIGATNVFRTSGPVLGALTFLADAAKGWLAAWGALHLDLPPWGEAFAGLAAFYGHIFPVFLRFRGGKGVATGWGVFLALVPEAAWIALGLFALGVAASRYVSVGSMLAALAMPSLVFYFQGGTHPFFAAAILCSLGVLVRHRGNLRRLLQGKERSWRG
jgi:glycerol-3-phosphate acyltransferase PlsY